MPYSIKEIQLRIIPIIFVLIGLTFFVCILNVSAASPAFISPTPVNYATSTSGTAITVSVDSDDAIGAEHEVVFDWNNKLVGWWRFNTNGDLTDYSTSSNTMTSHGATWSSSGKYAGAYDFDALADYLSVSDSDLNITATDEYTISIWINPHSTSNNKVLQLGTDGSSGSYAAFLTAGNGQTAEYALRQNWNGDWTGVTSAASLQSNSWNHIVVTNDGTNLRIYINGSLSKTQALGAFTNYTANYDIMVGKDFWSNYFDGLIDDFQFYKRTLSAAEISSLYNGQTNQYSASFTPSSNGIYPYRAYTQDTSGNISPTEQRYLYVGTTPPNFTLAYSAGANGSLTGSTTQIVAGGSNGTAVTAVPATGYSFVNWSDSSTTNPRTDTSVAGNVSVTANFSISSYTINYTANAGGAITGSSTQVINHGSDATEVTAVPNLGFTFTGWDDGATSTSRTDTNIAANASYAANFTTTTYTVSYSAGTGGSVSGSSSQTVDYNSSSSAVTAVASSGYFFSAWSDGLTANPRIDENVTSNISVSAVFSANPATGAVAITLPSGVGTGLRDSGIISASVIGAVVNVGAIDTGGVNVLTYITNDNKFTTPESSNNWLPASHNFVITNFNIADRIVEIQFSSEPVTLTLTQGETQVIDIDGDRINDISVTFADTYINRAEITLKSLKTDEIKSALGDTVQKSNYNFKRSLKSGMRGEDVRQLQRVLNVEGFTVSATGLGSLGNETAYFGSATKQALIKFQKHYNLKPYPGTVGPATIKLLNSL